MINGFVHPNAYIARVDGILFQFYRDRIPLEAAQAAKAVAAVIVEEQLKPFALYIENAPKTKPPEGETRRILTDLGMRAEGCVACTFVAAGGGFISAASRAIMASMANLARTKYPIDVSKGPVEGIGWLAEQTGHDAQRLISARERMLRAWDFALTSPEEMVSDDLHSDEGAAVSAAEVPARDEADSAIAARSTFASPTELSDPNRSTLERPKRALPRSLKEAFAPREPM